MAIPSFRVAGFEFTLGPDSGRLSRLGAFVPAVAGSTQLVLKIEPGPAVTRPPGWEPKLPKLRSEPDGALALDGDGFTAWVSADRRTGWVRQGPEAFPVEAVIRVLLADSLLRRGGLLVHGVALAHRGRAALFTGNSGAGKSTLGHWGAAGGLTLLSDELVAVLPEDAGFTCHSTPWNAGGGPAEARLGLIGLLSHAPSAELAPVAPSEVLRVLLGNVLEPGPSAEVRAELFRIASRLLASVPTKRLAFAPNLEVAATLRNGLG